MEIEERYQNFLDEKKAPFLELRYMCFKNIVVFAGVFRCLIQVESFFGELKRFGTSKLVCSNTLINRSQ